MADEPCITLFSSGLLSKFGFCDGDVGWDEWYDYCEEHDLPEDIDVPLVELVQRYLLPKLAEHHIIETYVIETNHNPIRAERVDGVKIDRLARNDEVQLRPMSVDVPMADVARIALAAEVRRLRDRLARGGEASP